MFLNVSVSFKTLKGENFCQKNISEFRFSCYITQLITCSGLIFLLVHAKYLIRVHKKGQINILIGMHCSDSLGFSFENHG